MKIEIEIEVLCYKCGSNLGFVCDEPTNPTQIKVMPCPMCERNKRKRSQEKTNGMG